MRAFIRINGKLISRTFSRQADADRWYAEMRHEKEMSGAGLQTISHLSFKEFSERWLQTRRSNGQPLSSYRQEEARLRLYILPQFGEREMSSIQTVEWENFLDRLVVKEYLGPATRNRVRALLSKMYNDARRQQVVSQNPISILQKLKERMKKWDYWQTGEECARYLREPGSFHLFAATALNTGARIGEIIALTHQDVDLERRRIRIWRIIEATSGEVCERTKSFNERWLGINDALYPEIAKAMLNGSPGQFLVRGLAGGQNNHRTLRGAHIRVCKRAGVRVIRIHDLRHTFASHYVMNGGSLTELQGLLGHTSSAMTLKYAHLAPGFLESRAKLVSFTIGDERAVKLVVSR